MVRERLETAIAEVAQLLRSLSLVAPADEPELAKIQSRLAGPGLNGRFLALTMYPTLARLIRSTDRQGQPAHFLASEAWYQEVRMAHLGDRILPLVGDFSGSETFARLGSWLRARGLVVSTFYISDVEFFLIRSGKLNEYEANLRSFPGPTTPS